MRLHAGSCTSALFVLALLAGCAAPGGTMLQESGDRPLRTRLEFVDKRLNTIPEEILRSEAKRSAVYPGGRFPDRLWLAYGYTPGRPAGPAAPDLLFRFSLHRDKPALERHSQQDFEVNLGFIERSLARTAAPMSSRPEDQGLAVSPADARIARLLFGLFDSLHYPIPAVVGFIDRASGAQLALLYADRPARITGRIDLAHTGTFVDADATARARFTGSFDHDIRIPSAGLHWLQIREVGPRSFHVSRVEPAGPVTVFVLESAVARATD